MDPSHPRPPLQVPLGKDGRFSVVIGGNVGSDDSLLPAGCSHSLEHQEDIEASDDAASPGSRRHTSYVRLSQSTQDGNFASDTLDD